jgi:hypothetical protein
MQVDVFQKELKIAVKRSNAFLPIQQQRTHKNRHPIGYLMRVSHKRLQRRSGGSCQGYFCASSRVNSHAN